MEGKVIFITGGAGFIATNMIKRLIAANKIVIYDNLSHNALKDSGLWDHPHLRIIQRDVLDYASSRRA